MLKAMNKGLKPPLGHSCNLRKPLPHIHPWRVEIENDRNISPRLLGFHMIHLEGLDYS